MKKIALLLLLLATVTIDIFAQGAKNIKINEVLTNNTANIQDEYGEHVAWVELVNSSYTTYNVRGMYITTNREVLNPKLSAPERQNLMSLIPNGDEQTVLTGHKHILFYLTSNPSEGTRHLNAKVNPDEPLWIALYDGNGVDLIDSISIPVLEANESYARISDGNKEWSIHKSTDVTAGIANKPDTNNKISRTKAEDPHGFAITILAMGTVFCCLALLYIFFRILGIVMDHLNKAKKVVNKMPLKPVTKTVEKTAEVLDKTAIVLKDGTRTKGIDKKVYIAVIAMAIKQYQDDVHDVESGIISIKPKHTNWNNLVK